MKIARGSTMHLLAFVQHSFAGSHAQMMWAHPRNAVGQDFAGPRYWEDLGRTLERGCFDAMFIADAYAPYDFFEDSARNTLRRGVQFPMHDPAPLIPIVANATDHLGIALTSSTFSDHPYVTARRLATLDHLSGGRVGWNVVNSHARNEFKAVGLEKLRDHSERYARGAEFVDLCLELWDSWEPGALLVDRKRGLLADPDRIKRVEYEGEFYRCSVEFPVTPSPQGRPVIFQAGGSGTGRAFAAKYAEAVFAIQPDAPRMDSYAADVRRLAVDAGRDPDSIRLIMGAQCIVGATAAEAEEKHQELRELVADDATLTLLSGAVGADFASISPDAYADEIEAEGLRSMIESLSSTPDGRRTSVREVIEAYKLSCGAPVLVGSGTEVADQIEMYMSEADIDGMNIMSTYMPGCYVEFVEMVVPELQRRGLLRSGYSGRTLRDHLAE